MSQEYAIYGSGDSGTGQLCAEFYKRAIPYTLCDIRLSRSAENMQHLRRLLWRGINTVPVLYCNDQFIGDFEAAMVFITANRLTPQATE